MKEEENDEEKEGKETMGIGRGEKRRMKRTARLHPVAGGRGH